MLSAPAPMVIGPMTAARSLYTATLLPNGTVLVAGGYDYNDNALASAEIFNPRTGLWRATVSMQVARAQHTATLLPDGTVLIAGGYTTSAEHYTSTGSICTRMSMYLPLTAQPRS